MTNGQGHLLIPLKNVFYLDWNRVVDLSVIHEAELPTKLPANT